MTMNHIAAARGWLACPEPRPRAAMRLFCLPYAGGGGAPCRAWAQALPADIELNLVLLPGREARLREAPYADMCSLIEALTPALAPALDQPFALFGHSMGALIAFELARALQRDGVSAPLHLFASGRRAPEAPAQEPPLRHLPDPQFVREMVARYNAIPQIILEDEDMLRVFLPTLRADMALLETYNYRHSRPLDCPITAMGGSNDARATRVDLAAWRSYTAHSFQLIQFPGDHFYLHPQRQALVAQLANILAGQS